MSEPAGEAAPPRALDAAPARRPAAEREVRALPVVAASLVLVTAALVVYLGRGGTAPARPVTQTAGRRADEPQPVRDVDHYVPGSPPAVAERFLRARLRYRYDEARDLSTGEMRRVAEARLAEVGQFNRDQMEEFRRTRVYVDAANYDLEHVEIRDLPPGPSGAPRKEVRGQAHGYANYPGARMDSRRGQTFVLELVDGAWRVAEWTPESFER